MTVERAFQSFSPERHTAQWSKTLRHAETQQLEGAAGKYYDMAAAGSYDGVDALKNAPLKAAGSGTLLKNHAYTYDDGSNRTTELVGATNTTSIYNNVNQLTSQTGVVNRTLTYDHDRNLTGDGTRSYEWDPSNRLTAINVLPLGGLRTEFLYNALSQRIKIIEKNGVTITKERRFLWDDARIVVEYNGSNAVTKRFYPHWMIEGTGTYYYYTRDHLGSIRELIDSNRVVRARYDYDPYGRRSANQITFNAVEADFGYTGHFHHAPSGLALAPFRAYSADLGRWLSRDPIAEDGGVNLYGYVKCNPLNQIDVLGLAPLAQDEYFNMTGGVGSGFCQLTLGFSKDSTGQSYLSPGFSFGLGLPLSFTATTNKFHKNDKTSINNPASFLKEGSITATAACGKAYSASPTSDNRTAKGTGIGSPQIGAGWSWGFLWNKYQNK